MPLFVIAKANDPVINSPVFHAGQDGTDEAVALFTNRNAAEGYIDAAGWNEVESVIELQPVELLRWLLAAHDGGTTILAVDPEYDAQQNVSQPSLPIPELIEELVAAVRQRIELPAPPPPSGVRMVTMDLLHCQQCGKLIEQRAGQPPQTCCGEQMTIAASNTIKRFAASS